MSQNIAPSRNKLKLAVLASGRGSNLQALINACESGEANARVVLVLTDNPDAYALERAKKHGIAGVAVIRKEYKSREEFDARLADLVEESGACLVCLAGFMRILSNIFLSRFGGWVINIHPALLPSFPGLDAQKQALDYGVKVTGATVHFVDEGVDTGRIILQKGVDVDDDDNVESLSVKILKQEHIIYPEAVRLIATGLVKPPGIVRSRP